MSESERLNELVRKNWLGLGIPNLMKIHREIYRDDPLKEDPDEEGESLMPIRNVKAGWTIPDKDPGPGAEDRGSGPEFRGNTWEHLIVPGEEATAEEQNREWDDQIKALGTLTLHPVVLAQIQRNEDIVTGTVQLIGSMGSPHCDLEDRLQRIEDMLSKISSGTVICPHCGDASSMWQNG